jgi:carbamate kinase
LPKQLAVIAIGGNSLIKHRAKRTVADQYKAICETIRHIVDLVDHGYQLVITHGNGPQVGFIMLRSEIARKQIGLHIVPLSSCVADTQGAIGLQIQQALTDELEQRNLCAKAVTIVTQVEVRPTDPGFLSPDKPIGEFYTTQQLAKLKQQHPEWVLKEDANRGWRRVVASPVPLKIVEQEAINALLEDNYQVIAAGGGGVAVVRSDAGLTSVDAVIDKDKTAALLAANLQAPLLVISTAVEQVMLNFGTTREKAIGRVSVKKMEQYLRDGHFAPGSMEPKIKAAIQFLKNGGQKVIITNPENIGEALRRGKGTQIVR